MFSPSPSSISPPLSILDFPIISATTLLLSSSFITASNSDNKVDKFGTDLDLGRAFRLSLAFKNVNNGATVSVGWVAPPSPPTPPAPPPEGDCGVDVRSADDEGSVVDDDDDVNGVDGD